MLDQSDKAASPRTLLQSILLVNCLLPCLFLLIARTCLTRFPASFAAALKLVPPACRVFEIYSTQISSKQGLVKKESCLRILDYPCKAFFQIYTGNGTASDDVPFVRSNGIELQPLRRSTISAFRLDDITERQTSARQRARV